MLPLRPFPAARFLPGFLLPFAPLGAGRAALLILVRNGRSPIAVLNALLALWPAFGAGCGLAGLGG